MTEQEAIAEAVFNTPDPDRFVDCGESRPLAMFHMATLMQYGEQCANAALAYLRSQGEPVMWMYQRKEPLRFNDGQSNDQRECERVPLYLAPVAKVPEGWSITDCGDGTIIVQKRGFGGYASNASHENIASAILHALAKDMLAAAPEYKEE